MKIIYPAYGTGIIRGFEMKKSDITIEMIAYLYNEDIKSLRKEWDESEQKEDLDWLNFCAEQEKEPTLNLQWPDQWGDDDVYCIVGIIEKFEDIKNIDSAFRINDQLLLDRFKHEFQLDSVQLEMVSIGTED